MRSGCRLRTRLSCWRRNVAAGGARIAASRWIEALAEEQPNGNYAVRCGALAGQLELGANLRRGAGT